MTFYCSYADTLTLTPSSLREKINLLHYWEAREEHPLSSGHFMPLNQLEGKGRNSVYWLKCVLHDKLEGDTDLSLVFTHLTYVDLYLYYQGNCILYRQGGSFQPDSNIAGGDGRFHFSIPLRKNGYYTLLLKVRHTKLYKPNFNFELQQKGDYFASQYRRNLVNGWMQGAIAIFLLYILLSWVVTKYKPYLWLLLFIIGVGLYGISTGEYFIEWFFKNDPATGWLFNVHFLHVGFFGLYMLIVDFWQLQSNHRGLYRYAMICIGILVVVTISSFTINYFTGNFNLTNNINMIAHIFPFTFSIAALHQCINRLKKVQLYLYAGMILFMVAGVLVVISALIFREKALVFTPYISNFTLLVMLLLFSTGLKEEQRQNEIEKNKALDALYNIQQHQNVQLENKVKERTRKLEVSNKHHQTQAKLLRDRNLQIELLINELSHRVKNNLQLLYSLLSLQLPLVKDEHAKDILQVNIARIKAMMLVNKKLIYDEDQSSVSLIEFADELFNHIQQIYDNDKKVTIQNTIPTNTPIDSTQMLSMGMILCELITNSFKYAFINHENPLIQITAAFTDNQMIELTYYDNGIGIQPSQAAGAPTLGQSIIHDLIRQLRGSVIIEQKNGLLYKFIFPINSPN